ncbi:response regulator transcription factor [Paenibacillus sp. SYP-B3998]|uniref:Response regulator transcription factor n=1 Tax=Paenibacillus sp. SYP-B3998 TaxID=2678564 RepID=A0A6G4A2G8_9BACL|nr:response regulator transcription factor [Paenibacillus sp. SYP-B3998]NEW08575.1 response regulator transcription factor [Paenibacillus sp. SYP-B3998]
MAGEHIMLVEDEEDIRELVRLYLVKEGYRVSVAENGEQAMELASKERFDLFVLDIMLPDANGMELCRRIRANSNAIILFLTCKRESDDIIAGLENGADDYVVKPFNPKMLVARVTGHLRRSVLAAASQAGRRKDGQLWRHGRLEVDFGNYDVRVDGDVVPMYAKEKQLLTFFIENPNHVFNVGQLYDRIWGWDRESDERTVMVHIRNLRKKIEEDPGNPRYVVTVRGFGYKFCLE